MKLDLSCWRGLYAIIDVQACGTRPPEEVATAVLAGGCAVLQLRAKQVLGPIELRALARAIQALCKQARVPFVVNDDVALAIELGADGVHIGQADMPIARARALLPNACIGVSTHSLVQAQAAQRDGADLIGFGPVFATASKLDPDPIVGVHGLAEVVATTALPVVAIGGIDRSNIDQVTQTGVPLVACIGALCKARDPRAAAAALHQRVTR